MTTFYRMIPSAPLPVRASRHAMGELPKRAQRHCDAATLACSFGWYVFPPMDFAVCLQRGQIFWTFEDRDVWFPLGAAQFPRFAQTFDKGCPADLRGKSPPFLTALPERGLLQIWTGYFARSAPGWSLLMRAPPNLRPTAPVFIYEGLVEADRRFFSPVFANVELPEDGSVWCPSTRLPLLQLQPVPRAAYAEDAMKFECVASLAGLTDTDWSDYGARVFRKERAATYAIAARKRRKSETKP